MDDLNQYTLVGQVITPEGNTFTGTFYLYFYKAEGPSVHSQYFKNTSTDLAANRCFYGIDNSFILVYSDGNVVDKQNKIVGMYRNNAKLDAFDMEAVLAAEQGKIDKERAAAKKVVSDRKEMESRFGKKYTDAFYSGKVIVGMPWKLVEMGNDAHSFKDFYSLLPYLERSTSNRSVKCYSMVADNFRYIGLLWVENDKVSSITYF